MAEYYPMIKATAEKFSEVWNGQALSDIVRCACDGLVAFKAGDTKQLAKYRQHLRDNYFDYLEIAEPAEFTVARVYDWLRLAEDSLLNRVNCFSASEVTELFQRWFQSGSLEYGDSAYRWRKADIASPMFDLADRLALQKELDELKLLRGIAESLRFCGIIDAKVDIGMYDMTEYITQLVQAVSNGTEPIKAIRDARAWLANHVHEPRLAISPIEK